MTTYQQMYIQTLPLDDGKMNSKQTAISAQGSVGSSFTSISSSMLSDAALSCLKGDLLPDLWKTSSNSSSGSSASQVYHTPQTVQAPFGGSVWSVGGQTVSSPPVTFSQKQAPMPMNGSVVGGDPLPNYAHSLLPNNLLNVNEFNQLPQLTEENLMFNNGGELVDNAASGRHGSAFSDGSEELFKFEQQQQQQQQQQQMQVQVQKPVAAVPGIEVQPQFNNVNQSQPTQHNNHGHSHCRGHNSHNSHNSHTPQSQHSPGKSHKTSAVNTQLYKTELCASFMKMGGCPYGSKCQFAHGENELKRIERPPKWRSKPCENWSKFGSCRYGNRCCFKHGN